VLIGLALTLGAWTPLPVEDDPLVFMPGSQPGDGLDLGGLETCVTCHGQFDPDIEPVETWQGSMMGQATRDPLFWAALTVAAQDSIWALGRPNATDLCLRCHSPEGWLGGRSDPTHGADLAGTDHDGIHCVACHRMADPFFEDTYTGVREGSDWAGYWDESNLSGTPSQEGADQCYALDLADSAAHATFSGQPLYDPATNLPAEPGYVENGSGQMFIASAETARGNLADAGGVHAIEFSRYHRSRYFCATCHDTSNPALANLAFEGTAPGDGVTVLPSESSPPSSYFHVERTFSEFALSDYGQQGGAAGSGAFDPALLETSRPGNWVASCQDCHMPDSIGYASGLPAVSVLRPTDSIEHPETGISVHTLAGGNVWVTWLLASTDPTSPNHDPTNEDLLGQGPAVLTLDLDAGLGTDPVALLASVERSRAMLESAASLEQLDYDPATGELSFRIVNHTGHKLISGFPEGRRMFVQIELWEGGAPLHTVNPYDDSVGTLAGLPPGYSPDSPALAADESHVDELVIEMHPTSSLTGEQQTFHFVLADGRHKDNRIPPRGFRVAEAADRLCLPVDHGVEDAGYFSDLEYAGGYDDHVLSLPAGADAALVRLLYQTTSREYVAFLRDEINGAADTLVSPTPSEEPQAYVAQTDPFFAGLRSWGDTIWDLWDHNRDVPGAAPVLMAEALWSDGGCIEGVDEVCDGFDNDCDGLVDDDDPDLLLDTASVWYGDADGDGHGDPAVEILACDQPDDASADALDCDDGDPTAYTGAVEDPCDGVDNDCDGDVDEDRVDGDGDGTDECEDCDDGDETAFPGAEEICDDGVDNDCDGLIDGDDGDDCPSGDDDTADDDTADDDDGDDDSTASDDDEPDPGDCSCRQAPAAPAHGRTALLVLAAALLFHRRRGRH